jgi:hypothetical protein
MVGLEIEVVKKLRSKVGEGKAEAALKMRKEDDMLSGFEDGLDLLTRGPTYGAGGDPVALDEPKHVADVGVRAYPIGPAPGPFGLALLHFL